MLTGLGKGIQIKNRIWWVEKYIFQLLSSKSVESLGLDPSTGHLKEHLLKLCIACVLDGRCIMYSKKENGKKRIRLSVFSLEETIHNQKIELTNVTIVTKANS